MWSVIFDVKILFYFSLYAEKTKEVKSSKAVVPSVCAWMISWKYMILR